jgi:CDP-paratose 2-epimerase
MAEYAFSRGHKVYGCDSDQRGRWFGKAGSVEWRINELVKMGISVTREDFRHRLGSVAGMDLIVHCASQPSHDFSRSHVLQDSAVNYLGTVELLEAYRTLAPKAVFAFLSTNKVYGDRVNRERFREEGERFVPMGGAKQGFDPRKGISEDYTIDDSLHTPFGVSKTAADLMVQEYRECFGLKTVTFRCGCLTGKAGSAIELQGFLGYLVKCAVEGREYRIYGHGGYQVRDNIAAEDVASAILAYADNPKDGVYNLGGGPDNSISVLEAIRILKTDYNLQFPVTVGPERVGDHKWWITDTRKFERDYPDWKRKPLKEVLREMVECERRRGVDAPRDSALPTGAQQETRIQ